MFKMQIDACGMKKRSNKEELKKELKVLDLREREERFILKQSGVLK